MSLEVFLIYAFSFVAVGEGLNCKFPYHDGEYDNSGMLCQWEHDSFDYDAERDRWILKKEYSDDNYFEAKSRKRYWEKN